MKDQGFAVAPGTHTLLGVKRYEVNTDHNRNKFDQNCTLITAQSANYFFMLPGNKSA